MSRANGAKQVGNKQWPHPPDSLLRGRLVYVVKFYGDQEVDQPKGSEPIKEAIRKIKFNKQVRRSEGQKSTPKVELHINVDGIAIHEPKTKVQQYKFPLHNISYCADDKTERKLFSFIAKDGASGKHHCFVLGSERNAEEITLTIGQAFDLAYKRFLEKQESPNDAQKQTATLQATLQQQIQQLQDENKALKARIAELEGRRQETFEAPLANETKAVSPNNIVQPPAAGHATLFDDDFSLVTSPVSPTNASAVPQKLAPPPPMNRSYSANQTQYMPANQVQYIPANPTPASSGNTGSLDAFGMPSFNLMEIEDMRSAFLRGLAIEDFDLNSLDPLNH